MSSYPNIVRRIKGYLHLFIQLQSFLTFFYALKKKNICRCLSSFVLLSQFTTLYFEYFLCLLSLNLCINRGGGIVQG